MPTIIDPEFGEIVIKKYALSTNVSLKIAPDGRLRVSLPTYAPIMAARLLIKSSRPQIRTLLAAHHLAHAYVADQQIGKSHHLIIRRHNEPLRVMRSGTQIVATVPPDGALESPIVQQHIRQEVLRVLRKEAKAYLPRRAQFLADTHGYSYNAIKLTHASSRWGSCSSRGTISLNIGLMNLPFELLDYVICHELAHTRQMNHSAAFWREVEAMDPYYVAHRRQLKQHSPHI